MMARAPKSPLTGCQLSVKRYPSPSERNAGHALIVVATAIPTRITSTRNPADMVANRNIVSARAERGSPTSSAGSRGLRVTSTMC